VHAHHSIQDRLAQRGYRVYDFALPLLVLHALGRGSAAALREHLRNCPRRQVTLLDCHDGIPVQPDLDGLLPVDEAQWVVQRCLEQGANLSRIFSPQHRLRPDFDAHQVNCAYYSALGARDEAYLAARAIQFFAPGIPQVYYHGLLAGENTPAEVERAGDRRAINRPNYTRAGVERALQKPVVQRLLNLIRLRNTHPAFGGEFDLPETGDDRELALRWRRGERWCLLRAHLPSGRAEILTSEGGFEV
jgi:sucrose phosphorylase